MKLDRRSLSDQIYETLKGDILARSIEPGQKLINRELQRRFSVSSTPVRDAINHLYLDGLVGNITNSGARVLDFDLKFTLDVNAMVSILCCAALELCVQAGAQEQVCARLKEIVARQQQAGAGERYYELDAAYHQTFFDCCGNAQLVESYARHRVLWEMLVRRFHALRAGGPESIRQHEEIADALRAGEPARALRVMRAHFEVAAALFTRYMGRGGAAGTGAPGDLPPQG